MATWWDYFKEDPDEEVGRLIKDSFGLQRSLKMPRLYWAYVDWLVEVEGCDAEAYFAETDAAYRPELDGDYDRWVAATVYGAYILREHDGFPRPAWLPPATQFELDDVPELRIKR